MYFLGVAVTSSLVKGGTDLVGFALIEEVNPKEFGLAG